MKRVLLMVRTLWNGGGTETYVLTLAQALRNQGIQVGVYTSGGPWVPYFRSKGLRVHVAPHYAASGGRLLAIAAKYGYRNVHAQDGPSLALLAGLSRRPFRCLATLHGSYVAPSAVRSAGRIASAVFLVSPRLAGFARTHGVPQHKIRIIPNGIDLREFRPAPAPARKGRPFTVGYAGRFTWDKARLSGRIGRLLHGYRVRNPYVNVRIAGRGSQRMLRSGRGYAVLGQLNRMGEFYRSCDVVIGTARVALEAMACGVPTIAVGYYRYIGPVTQENFQRARHSNFGDHGKQPTPWNGGRLLADLYRIHANVPFWRRQAAQLQQRVRGQFSAGSMARRISQFYQ